MFIMCQIVYTCINIYKHLYTDQSILATVAVGIKGYHTQSYC